VESTGIISSAAIFSRSLDVLIQKCQMIELELEKYATSAPMNE
jgi:hypothetical protein